jgi:glycosyltransferase involved in cell wall biosynthesis
MKTENTPIISIICTAYNQENYIKDALEGFVNQKTNFPFEIIVHDDASTDKTASLIKEYEIKYPNLFVAVYQIENQYSKKNGDVGKIVFGLARGKYIALCEGDDYWTDPLKLQKQVDFLEANPDYVLCFHQVNILKINGEIVDDFITKVPENYETIETLARLGNYIHTPSVVFRNTIKEFPFEFSQSPIGDYFLYMLLAEHGKLKYLEKNMAVYREGVGVWSDKSAYFRNLNTALLHTYLFDYFSRKEDHLILGILLERIGRFIKSFESQISKEELTILCSNKIIRTSILDLLLINMEQLRNKSIDKKKTNELIAIIFERFNKRIWKK